MKNDSIIYPENGSTYLHDVMIQTENWLENISMREIELPKELSDGWDNNSQLRSFIEHHASVENNEGMQYVEGMRDNCYNHENDFSSVFTFSVYVPHNAHDDWLYVDNVYVALCVHIGGDVRGNYGNCRLFETDSLGDSSFFDWMIGWDIQKDGERLELDNYSIGYAQNPTYELESDLEKEENGRCVKGEWQDGKFIATLDGEAVECVPYVNEY
tara:strand:- start:190 stop:831 length:642 start_codon:yes stop_codon:yes gene_type:complete